MILDNTIPGGASIGSIGPLNLLVTVNYMSLIKVSVEQDYFHSSTYNIYGEIESYSVKSNNDIPLDEGGFRIVNMLSYSRNELVFKTLDLNLKETNEDIYIPRCDNTILFIQNRTNSSSTPLLVRRSQMFSLI